MPDPVKSKDFDLFVADLAVSPITYVAVDGVSQWDDSTARERTAWPMLMRDTDYQTVGSREITYSMQGFKILTDPGQVIIRAAEEADDAVNIKVLHDGTNGYTQDVIIGTKSGSVVAGSGLQTMTLEIAAIAQHVLVGSGPGP
jgi:hypothetical protein